MGVSNAGNDVAVVPPKLDIMPTNPSTLSWKIKICITDAIPWRKIKNNMYLRNLVISVLDKEWRKRLNTIKVYTTYRIYFAKSMKELVDNEMAVP